MKRKNTALKGYAIVRMNLTNLCHHNLEAFMQYIVLFLFCSLLLGNSAHSQETFSKVTVGRAYSLSLPAYFTKTVGLNTAASLQFKSEVKDVYGFIITDPKEELSMADLKFTSINEFHDSFMETFLSDQKSRSVGTPKKTIVGGIKFLENEVTYYDENAQTDITYYVGIAETDYAYYKMLCWTTKEKKDLFKKDFHTMLFSMKD
jgi:hypothetical protein